MVKEKPRKRKDAGERGGGGDTSAVEVAASTSVASTSEKQFLAKLKELVDDGSSVRGRDADVIKKDADVLAGQLDSGAVKISKRGTKQAREYLKEIDDSAAFEAGSAKVLQYGIMACMFVPAAVSLLESLLEFPSMDAVAAGSTDLHGWNAVVTGGCGAMGLELAVLLARAGAGVVIGCHEGNHDAQDAAESRLAELGLMKGSRTTREVAGHVDVGDVDSGWVEVTPLQLESFASVRHFARSVVDDLKGPLNLLVHNAATKHGCIRTTDGHEHVTQVNQPAKPASQWHRYPLPLSPSSRVMVGCFLAARCQDLFFCRGVLLIVRTLLPPHPG
jgi:hypothetical protein